MTEEETYLSFVEERHRIWERRQAGEPGPWTTDPILRAHKFTNVFRVLDYGSQYLLTLLDGEPRDALMRAFLYRHTGRVEPWEFLELTRGLPLATELDEVLRLWTEYRGDTRMVSSGSNRKGEGRVLRRTFQNRLFTGAYLVFPQTKELGSDKLESVVRLAQRLFDPSSPTDIMPDFLAARSQAERFAVLRRNPGVADFMSMQVLTDWGYRGDTDLEDEFVVLGPGAKRGAKIVGRPISWAVEQIRSSPDCPMLNSRPPSLMDVQNTLCEYSKYARYAAAGPQPERPYRAVHSPSTPVLPAYYRRNR